MPVNAYQMLIPQTIHLSSRDNKPDLHPNMVRIDPKHANDNEAVCQATRKIRRAAGFNPVEEACNFGKMSRSPRNECPKVPKKEGNAANKNNGRVMF